MVTRSGLPQNHIISAGETVSQFGSLSGWTVNTTTPTIDTDASHLPAGVTAGIKVTPVSYASPVSLTCTLPSTLFTSGVIKIDLYNDSTEILYTPTVQIMLSTSASWWDVYLKTSNTNIPPGNSTIFIHPTDFSVGAGSITLSQPMVTLNVKISLSSRSDPANVTISRITANIRGNPKMVICFDDNYQSQKDVIYPILEARRMKATIFPVPAWLGTTQASYPRLSLADVQYLYDRGWAVGNHTYTHASMVGRTLEEAQSIISTARAYWTENLGSSVLQRGMNFFAYPGGSYDANAIAALIAEGVIIARATTGSPSGEMWPFPAPRACPSVFIQPASAGSMTSNEKTAFKNLIKRSVSCGTTQFVSFHNVSDTPIHTNDLTLADFTEMIDFIASLHVPCITIDEWYNGLTNPRYRSLPVGRT